MLSLLLLWILVTLGSTVGLLAFLAFDEWQVRSRAAAPKAAVSKTTPSTRVPQLI